MNGTISFRVLGNFSKVFSLKICSYRAFNSSSDKRLLVYCIIFIIIIINIIIEKNEMDEACGTYGGRERCAQGFGGET